MADQHPCAVCNAPTSKQCARCNAVFYCTKPCQTSHWKQHRLACFRAATVDEVNRLLRWTSQMLGRTVSSFKFGCTESIICSIDYAQKHGIVKLPIFSIVDLAHDKSTGCVTMDCAIAAMLLKAFVANDTTMADYLPAMIQVPGNKAVAVTTTFLQDPTSLLRTKCSINFALQWIAPVPSSSGTTEWWGFDHTGFRIALSKEAWGADQVALHARLFKSEESARELLLQRDYKFCTRELIDLICTISRVIALSCKKPLEAVYQ